MADARSELLGDLLAEVSRSFYLTLRVLPRPIRPQIGLAYLLARTTDTIADTELLPVEKRLAALESFRQSIADRHLAAPDFGEFAAHQGSPAERRLLEKCSASLKLLDGFRADDRERIQQVLDIITSGQELDLRRFANATAQQVAALANDNELDDYTYRVAGCVGEFWTRMCRAHLFPQTAMDDSWLLLNGVRFGKGLQLVNILRDLPADLRNGRCYLPASAIASAGLKPPDLLDPRNEDHLRPVYNGYLDLAEGHLRAGWVYTNMLPRRFVRVRLACAWPILIGIETLKLLHAGRVLDGSHRIKVSRQKLRHLLLRSVFLYPFPQSWQRLCQLSEP